MTPLSSVKCSGVSASQSGAGVRGSHQYKYVIPFSVVNLRIRQADGELMLSLLWQ